MFLEQHNSEGSRDAVVTENSALPSHGINYILKYIQKKIKNNISQYWSFFFKKIISKTLKHRTILKPLNGRVPIQVCFPSDFPSTSHRVLDDRIIILRAEERDTAVYQCEASNKHGTILANTNVLVMSEYFTVNNENRIAIFRMR